MIFKEIHISIRKCLWAFLLLATVFSIGFLSESAYAQSSIQTQSDPVEKEEELNILLVGNSLSYDTFIYAAKVAAAAGYTNVTIGDCYVSGSTLQNLWESMETSEDTTGDGTTEEGTTGDGTTVEGTAGDGTTVENTAGDGTTVEGTTGDGTTVENTAGDGTTGDDPTGDDPTGDGTEVVEDPLKPYSYRCSRITETGVVTTPAGLYTFESIMQDAEWDIVIFNELSNWEGIPDGTEISDGTTVDTCSYLVKFKNYVNELYPDARIGYEQTWAYSKSYTGSQFKFFEYSQEAMFQGIVSKCDDIWIQTGIDLIIPAGAAFQNARNSYLADYMSRDGKHASTDYGRVLAAMTLLSSCGLDLSDITDFAQVNSSISSMHMELMKQCVSDALEEPLNVQTGYQNTVPAISMPVLHFEGFETSVVINWDEVNGATRYFVQRLLADGTYKTVKKYQAGSSTYTCKRTFSDDGYYYYRVIAVGDRIISNTEGGSYASCYIRTPSGLTIKNQKKRVKLSWKKQTGGTGYQIYRRKNSGSYKQCAKLTSASKITFTDTSVKKNARYTYRIRAYIIYNGKYYYSKYASISVKR